MTTVFPNDFDSDLEIQRVDDNITEIGGDVINSLRDAVFMIERVVGLNPQGTKPSLSERVNVSIDEDGRIRSDAIGALGLASLPITNAHVGDDAGILESKLDLDFSTQSLKNSINSLATDISGAQSGISTLASSLSLHILGQGNFHDGYDIKINSEGDPQIGLAGLHSATVGDALIELVSLLVSGNPDSGIAPHMDLNLPYVVKHRASEIAVDASGFEIIDRTVTDVQAAFDSVDAKQGAFGARHLDVFHANGILREVSSGELFNPNKLLLEESDGANYTEGTSVITVPGVASFSSLGIGPGDILDISSDVLDQGTYQIRAVGPIAASATLGDLPALSANQLAIFHTFIESRVESDEVIISVYGPSSISSQAAPLACAIRNNETIVDAITILNPDSARVVSVGFNGAILNTDGYSMAIRVGLGNGQFRELTIPNLNRERLQVNQASPVDAKSVAERINAYVSDPTLGFHFPISAFRIGNELAIAHNLVGTSYTVEILDGYSANFALGLDAYGANVLGEIIVGNSNNSYVINGTELNTINTIFDGYASIETSTDTFALWTNDGEIINPLRYGITAGSVIHITGHEDLSANGSYTLLTSGSTTVSTFAAEPISAPSSPTVFNVKITDSHVSLESIGGAETDNGLVQILVNSAGRVLTHQRLVYGTNLGAAIEIVSVSDTFPIGDVDLNVILNGNLALFNIISDSFAGPTATIHKDFKGILKVYHPNNLDYILVKTIPGTISGGIETITVNAPLLSDEALQLCLIHFNGVLKATNIIDLRLFGNISSEQIRDDFVEIFSQRPVQELRADGVVRGFDILDIPFIDVITNMQAVPVQGGVAYVNGVRVAVETQRVLIQSVDEQGSRVTGPRIIAINEFGSLQVFTDELGEILSDGYDASSTFGKLLPLYQVSVVDGEITDHVDLRLFINNLDNKLELIVDETNNVVGNFRSLEGALLYASSYPNKEHLTIKIVNSVFPSRQVVVPNGISIIGSAIWGGDSKHQIINSNALGDSFIVLSGNNRLECIEIISELATTNGALVDIRGNQVNVEKCLLRFGQDVSTTDADIGVLISENAKDNVRVVNNKIDMVYSGVTGLFGCANLTIDKNIITNIAGTSGISNGIKLGAATTSISNASIVGNSIDVPDVSGSADIRGISINVSGAINRLTISDNYITHFFNGTMTNGIRIEDEDSVGSQIDDLFVSNNSINGIKLDDNDVWGIYISDSIDIQLCRNIISNVGVSGGNSDVGCIAIGANVGFADISHNILRDCDTTRGIEVTGANQVNISYNTLDQLGESSYFISGNATRSTVSNNILVGPGLKGVRWTGTNSSITNNNLSQPSDASGYAFQEHAIYAQTSDMDITNNTITGMVYDEGSIGISNVSAGRDRMKISGNRIMGSTMSKAIELFGINHNIEGNKIFNILDYSSGTTLIEFNDVSDSFVIGNILSGSASAAFKAVTGLDTSTFANNIIDSKDLDGNSTSIDIGFDFEVATNCFFFGNKIPLYGVGIPTNYIGTTTETDFGISTNNTIGMNDGMKDIRNLHASSGISAFSDSAPHWIIDESTDYWTVSNDAATTRSLLFPIDFLPNGASIISAQVNGIHNDDGDLTIQIFRKSRSSGDPSPEAISDPAIVDDSGEFGYDTDTQTDNRGFVEVTSSEVVSHYNYNYYVLITNTGSISGSDPVLIKGVAVTFRY